MTDIGFNKKSIPFPSSTPAPRNAAFASPGSVDSTIDAVIGSGGSASSAALAVSVASGASVAVGSSGPVGSWGLIGSSGPVGSLGSVGSVLSLLLLAPSCLSVGKVSVEM